MSSVLETARQAYGRRDWPRARDLFEAARGDGELGPITLRVHSEADDSVLEDLGRVALDTSPVADSLANPVPVSVSVEHQS